MSHTPVTHSSENPMPGTSDLYRRPNGRYYLNKRVPTDLRHLYGKTDVIRKSLDTSDYREAATLVTFAKCKLEMEFAAKRRELEKEKKDRAAVAPLLEINDAKAHFMASSWLCDLEKRSEAWWQNEGVKFSPEELTETVSDWMDDAAAYSGRSKNIEPEDGSSELELYLRGEGIECPKDSAAFRILRPYFRKARLENLERRIARATGKPFPSPDSQFPNVFAHSQIEAQRPAITLGELLRRFGEMQKGMNLADTTLKGYASPVRALREFFGERTALLQISGDKIEELFKLLQRAPTNGTKRYPGLNLAEAIAAADEKSDPSRLSSKTLKSYFVNITAIFNFAVAKRLMEANPAKDPYVRKQIENGSVRRRKVKFTVEELNRLFHAPLYTGCRDDKMGFAKPGKNHPRRGRFWVPLLALFHGFRLNEACQLYTEDVSEEKGVPFFEIRKERADGSKCEKRIKTGQSNRRVPIHPEIIRMGFLDYVAERRRDTSQLNLFPDLVLGSSGYYSNPFSKFFSGFKRSALGKGCKATFHSFRHHFRDGLHEAEISTEYVEALGGWGNERRSAERLYGEGPSLQKLQEKLAQLEYPGLDLAHLYAGQPGATDAQACRLRVRSRPRGV